MLGATPFAAFKPRAQTTTRHSSTHFVATERAAVSSALDVSTSGYEAGNVSFADVIGSYTLWLNSNLASERRRADVGIAFAELQRTVGASELSVAGSAKKTVDEDAND